jgi:hypothetical protein
VRKLAIGPTKNGIEQIGVRLVVNGRKLWISSRMAVYFQNCEVSLSSFFEQRNKPQRGPCDAVWCAFLALIIWNHDNGTDGKAVVRPAPSPPAQCDCNSLKPVARK